MLSRLVTALDIGTSKVTCLIARVDSTDYAIVIGVGYYGNLGMKNGIITDMEATECAIRFAVNSAERMAGETVNDVYISINGQHMDSYVKEINIAVKGHEITDEDIKKLLEFGYRLGYSAAGFEVIHAIPIDYTIDGNGGISDPRGMTGQSLGVNIHIVRVASGPFNNLVLCVSRAHLNIVGVVIEPYAASLACLSDDEMDMGVTLINIGAGVTSAAIFYNGSLVHIAAVNMGAALITHDIANVLMIPKVYAERIKTLYGSALGKNDDQEIINIPQIDEISGFISNLLLNDIIRARVEETLEAIREIIYKSGFKQYLGYKIVLSGGGAQLQGIGQLAQMIFSKQVRIANPIKLTGLPSELVNPAFSTVAGLLNYAIHTPSGAVLRLNGNKVSWFIGLWTRIKAIF